MHAVLVECVAIFLISKCHEVIHFQEINFVFTIVSFGFGEELHVGDYWKGGAEGSFF